MVALEGHSAEAFQLVVQWMYQGRISLPIVANEDQSQRTVDHVAGSNAENGTGPSGQSTQSTKVPDDKTQNAKIKRNPVKTASALIDRYLNFFVLADYISLLGPFNSVETSITKIVLHTRTALTCDHIRTAMALPSNHPIRTLFINATVKPYIEHILLARKTHFKYQQVVDEFDDYAADLMREFGRVMSQKNFVTARADLKVTARSVPDPVGGNIMIGAMSG